MSAITLAVPETTTPIASLRTAVEVMSKVAEKYGEPDSWHAGWIALFPSPADRKALWALVGIPHEREA